MAEEVRTEVGGSDHAPDTAGHSIKRLLQPEEPFVPISEPRDVTLRRAPVPSTVAFPARPIGQFE